RAAKRRLRCAHLLQPAGALHLARSAYHVLRRRDFLERPSLARRRAGTRAAHACPRARRMRLAMPSVQPAVAAIIATMLLAGAAAAVEPDEILPDAALEGRARNISAGLRCLVCQNQSIDDSSAPLARDLRILVRERLKAGDSDAQVTRFIEDR